MKRFSTLVSEKREEFNSLREAEESAFEEFDRGKRSALERNIQPKKGFLEPGKIYTFRYNPLRPDNLSYYDRNPLVLIVDRRKLNDGGYIDIGVNLNFLPLQAKTYLIDRLKFAYGLYIKGNTFLTPNNANKQGQLPINWFIAKRLLGKAGKFALRSYYPNRRSNTYAFSYEKWVDLMYLNVEDIEGANLNQIYKIYRNSK